MMVLVLLLSEGCTDTAAANYDATANTDDGSCHYCFGAYSVSIECGGGSFTSEVSWDLVDVRYWLQFKHDL